MKTKRQYRIGKLLVSLLSLTFVCSTLAGTPSDAMDPAIFAQDWESAVGSIPMTDEPAAGSAQRREALLDRAFSRGSVPVIVRFKTQTASPSDSRSSIQKALAASQHRVLDRLGLQDGRDRIGSRVKRFSHAQGLAMQADAIDVQDLLDDPEVMDVFEDVAYPPALIDSLPLIGASSNGAFDGYSGQGQVIAILDTGVDKNHPFLAGKVISEACYSSSYSSQGSTSLCPGGASESTAVNSGLNCNASLGGCSHGTHVAGIAAGRGTSFSGVARDAELIAIQIYSQFPSSACGGSPCVMAYTSDIIKGLERVHALRNSYPIAAVNLSLGGDVSTATCDRDPTKPMIDALRDAGIATVIASGNNGYTNAISAPGCVSTAVTVGSTTKTDEVSSFSNSASFLDLLAPGSAIYSSIIGNGFQTWNGTSMAAPHVAGAWAVLKSVKPTAAVDEVLAALQTTGVPINDAGLVKPRIEIADAIIALGGASDDAGGDPSIPNAPLANAASDITSSGFTANWDESAEAAGYRLDISTSSAFKSFVSSYNNRDLGDATNLPVTGLSANKTYFYRIRAYNTAGVGANSNVVTVTTSLATPKAPSANAASKITSSGFTANWGSVTGAVGYRLDISTNSAFSDFVSSYQNRDMGGARSAAVTVLSASTTYYYRVRAYNVGGVSADSTTRSVRTAIAAPQTPVANAATNVSKQGFNANWSVNSGATGYRLDVSTSSSFSTYVSGYRNLAVGNTSSRAVTRLLPNQTYYYRVRAYNTAGTSVNSPVQCVVTKS